MRIDKYLAQNGFTSRTKASRALEKGLIILNGKAAKASDEVKAGDAVEIRKEEIGFVSEGGFKLYKAFCEFKPRTEGKVFADLGASTGGFTDCLLRFGAARVYAVDVGSSQLAPPLCVDPRVVVMDGINARYLTGDEFFGRLDGVVADVSFISLTYLLPVIAKLLDDGGEAFVLIKPQFECGRQWLDKHGIVKDKNKRHEAVAEIVRCAEALALLAIGITCAPLKKGKNVEYVLYLRKGGYSERQAEIYDKLKKLD